MQDWYYTINGKQFGPVSFEELQNLLDQGRLYRQDMVWQKGMSDWQPAGTIAGLAPSKRRESRYEDDEPAREEDDRRRRPGSDIPQWPRVFSPSFSVLALLLFLLPWIDVRCNGFVLISQSGLQSCFGSYSDSGLRGMEQGGEAQAARQKLEKTKIEPAPFMICYFVLLLAGIALGFSLRIGLVRVCLVGFCTTAALAVLATQMIVGFPLKNAVDKEQAQQQPWQGGPPPGGNPNPFGPNPPFNPNLGRNERIDAVYTPWFWLGLLATAAPFGGIGLEQLIVTLNRPVRRRYRYG
jgi:hypothetical protein